MSIEQLTKELVEHLRTLDTEARIARLNAIREALHEVSPFADEPVDLVLWVKADAVAGNDYNPNRVAPPELKLLERSILADGYTQPIVVYPTNGIFEVVDGFHRNRVGRESPEVRSRVMGYLPVTKIRPSQEGRNERIAATIRHNRARGKHVVNAMSDIVMELARRGWSDQRIAEELGMDADEVLRLKQITGLAELFADREFSEAWEPDLAAGTDDRCHAEQQIFGL